MPLSFNFIAIGILVLINLLAFLVMFIDKRKAKRHIDSERIPEGVLFFLAGTFGSAGIFAGMMLLRHKTRKWYFVFGLPIIAAQNLTTLYAVYYFGWLN